MASKMMSRSSLRFLPSPARASPTCKRQLLHQSALRRPQLPCNRQYPASSTSVRHASMFSRIQEAHWVQIRQNPVMYPFALTVVFLLGGGVVYTLYLHLKMRREMGNYPESVGVKLRKAIYFTDHNKDPARAMKAYIAALNEAEAVGMHPLDDAVLGIYIQFARFLEIFGNIKGAIELLEAERHKCLEWIELHGDLEGNAGDRTRLLQKAIQFAFKIGELFSSREYPDKQKAEEYLIWSVETFYKENERRRREGLKPGEGELGLDPDQQGAQLEGVAHHFEEQGNFYFAGQLFLQALMLKPTTDCHSVILMNNIAAALAQQTPLPEPGTPLPSPEQLRENARVWLKRAIELAANIKAPQKTKECDHGCVAAIHNLGEFAEMDGNIREAREKYEEAGSLAHALSFDEGLVNANEGLKRLSAPPLRKGKSPKRSGSLW